MKLLRDYSKSELKDLDNEALNHLFAVECADRRIVLPSSLEEVPPAPENQDNFQPDLTLYQIDIGYGYDMVFGSSEDAQEVANKIMEKRVLIESKNRDYNNKRLVLNNDRELSPIALKPLRVYSTGRWNALKDEIEDYDSKKSEYDAIERGNHAIIDEHDEIWKDINLAVTEARDEFRNAERMKSQLEEYKTLTGGDESMAKRFLVNAHYDTLSGMSDEALEATGLSRNDIKIKNSDPEPEVEMTAPEEESRG